MLQTCGRGLSVFGGGKLPLGGFPLEEATETADTADTLEMTERISALAIDCRTRAPDRHTLCQRAQLLDILLSRSVCCSLLLRCYFDGHRPSLLTSMDTTDQPVKLVGVMISSGQKRTMRSCAVQWRNGLFSCGVGICPWPEMRPNASKALESNDAGSVLLVENVENASRVDCMMQQSECKEPLLLL